MLALTRPAERLRRGDVIRLDDGSVALVLGDAAPDRSPLGVAGVGVDTGRGRAVFAPGEAVELAPLGPRAPYRVIYADPPWSFDDRGSRIAPDSGKSPNGYPTLDTDAIARLPVRELAAGESAAVLFLWSTWSHLLDGSAARVARSWGFDPVTVYPWIKLTTGGRSGARFETLPTLAPLLDAGLRPVIGAGHYGRACSEPLLVCVKRRGRLTTWVPSLVVAPRGRHSAKPASVYDLIDALVPGGRALELFARRPTPSARWDSWGNE